MSILKNYWQAVTNINIHIYINSINIKYKNKIAKKTNFYVNNIMIKSSIISHKNRQ